ncbi:MAG: AraC family transcriptional regulator [Gammaproteobacteria bacterium]|nr:AraC family transcriptional regulator [Gammaproteobacteria bacterium]
MFADDNNGAVVIAGHARALLDYLRAHGTEPEALYPAGIRHPVESDDASQRIPVALWESMFQTAIAATGDPDLPLKVAESYKPRHYGMLGYLAMACSKLREVAEMMGRYERLTDDINESRLVLRGRRAELHWLPLAEPPSAIFAQLSLAGWIAYTRFLTGRPELPAEAYFHFPRPRDTSAYARVFRGPLHFGQRFTKLVFDAAYLDLPVVHRDPDTHKILLQQAEAMLGRQGDEPTFVRELKTTLSLNLVCGRVRLAETAHALGLAPRTVQRRLDELGRSFRDLLDEVRNSHAERHLRDSRLSLAEVAFLLGYSEQSPFHHAFRRWRGEAPGEYRRRVLSASAGSAEPPAC